LLLIGIQLRLQALPLKIYYHLIVKKNLYLDELIEEANKRIAVGERANAIKMEK